MPVHLGSMHKSVQTILKKNKGNIKNGDVFAMNAPYDGGTHLPDITVVTPIFFKKKLIFFVGSRGHHADIGGITPGSMTPLAKTIEEEGIIFENIKIISKGLFKEKLITSLLRNHKYPARNVKQNIIDLKAQVAANKKGLDLILSALDLHGKKKFLAYVGHIQKNAEESVKNSISKIKNAKCLVKTDNNSIIKVKLTVNKKKGTVIVDFNGSSKQLKNNFNAPKPVTIASVLYCFRVLVDKNIPMNSGCLKPIKIKIPRNSMLNPKYPSAVVAGNVETSQHITNLLFRALGVMAESQGTMNNLTFGNEKYQYYETICSGSPAGPNFNGTDAIQVHMTNSRLTDPEVLEINYPVILDDFYIVRNSGGKGKFKGGDGTCRKIKFLEKMELAILSSNRLVEPKGLNGGSNGKSGSNLIIRKNKKREILDACDQTIVNVGDTIIIRTPTPGGFGKK